jgi:hypothetical protein
MTPRDLPCVSARDAVTAALTAAFIAWSCGAALAQAPPPFTGVPAAPAVTVTPSTPPSVVATECGPCGKVESIRQTTAKQQWTPLGTGVGVGGVPDLGAAPAGVTSYRIGPDLSNQGMVVLGSAGGAAYKKTPNSSAHPRWEVTVKLDTGGVRMVTLSYEPFVREGDRVRVAGNNVELLD